MTKNCGKKCWSKNAQYSETYEKNNFPIIAIFSLWEMIDSVLKIIRKLGLREFWEPDSETLKSYAREPVG